MARATEPIAAALASLIAFPQTNAPPPLDTWMITGQLFFRAASSTALQVEELDVEGWNDLCETRQQKELTKPTTFKLVGKIAGWKQQKNGSFYLVQFTAGIAYPFSRACSNSARRSFPVTTPGGTIWLRGTMVCFTVSCEKLVKLALACMQKWIIPLYYTFSEARCSTTIVVSLNYVCTRTTLVQLYSTRFACWGQPACTCSSSRERDQRRDIHTVSGWRTYGFRTRYLCGREGSRQVWPTHYGTAHSSTRYSSSSR